MQKNKLLFVTGNYPSNDRERVGWFNKVRVEEYQRQGVVVKLMVVRRGGSTVGDVISFIRRNPDFVVYVNKLGPNSYDDFDVVDLLRWCGDNCVVPVVCVMGAEFDLDDGYMGVVDRLYRKYNFTYWKDVFGYVPCRFIGLSDFIWKQFKKGFKPLCDDHCVVSIGLNPEVFKAKHKPSKERNRVLVVKRLDNSKSLIPLILKVAGLCPRYKFTIVGRRPRRQNKVVRLLEKDRSNVVWVDRDLTRKELMKFFESHDLFFNPSLHEAQGILNLEAAAVGLPVVLSYVCCIPEFFKKTGVDGLLCKGEASVYARALNGLYGDKDLFDRISVVNKEKFRGMSLELSCKVELDYIFKGDK